MTASAVMPAVRISRVFAGALFAAAVLRAGEGGGATAGRRASTTRAGAGFDRAGAGGAVPTVDAAEAAASGAGLAFSRGSGAAGAGGETVASVSWTAGEAGLWGPRAAAAGTAELLRTATYAPPAAAVTHARASRPTATGFENILSSPWMRLMGAIGVPPGLRAFVPLSARNRVASPARRGPPDDTRCPPERTASRSCVR